MPSILHQVTSQLESVEDQCAGLKETTNSLSSLLPCIIRKTFFLCPQVWFLIQSFENPWNFLGSRSVFCYGIMRPFGLHLSLCHPGDIRWALSFKGRVGHTCDYRVSTFCSSLWGGEGGRRLSWTIDGQWFNQPGPGHEAVIMRSGELPRWWTYQEGGASQLQGTGSFQPSPHFPPHLDVHLWSFQ